MHLLGTWDKMKGRSATSQMKFDSLGHVRPGVWSDGLEGAGLPSLVSPPSPAFLWDVPSGLSPALLRHCPTRVVVPSVWGWGSETDLGSHPQRNCSNCGNSFCSRCCSFKVPRSSMGATGEWCRLGVGVRLPLLRGVLHVGRSQGQ